MPTELIVSKVSDNKEPSTIFAVVEKVKCRNNIQKRWFLGTVMQRLGNIIK